jgi:phosphatidylglycerol:prolipoprotein diacylglycerol transferase
VYPELFHWGVIHIRSYGLMLAIAFLVGTAIAVREARRLALDEDQLVTVVLVVLVASVLGARALYVLEHIEEFRRSWGSVLAVWQGGLTFYGGLIAGTVAGLLTARRMRLPMWTVADALTPSLALGTAFGRVGCFLNGCCYGHPTRLPWGVTFPPDSFAGLEFGNAKIHPSQLYFAIAGVALFAILWSLRRRVIVPGVLFWIFMILYSVVRVPLDATRAYESSAVLLHFGSFTLAESQIESFAIAMFSLLMILRLRREAAGRT